MGRFPGREIGPVAIWIGDTTSTAAQVGDTKGPVTLQFEESAARSTLNKSGTTARSKVITGVTCIASGALGEATIEAIATITGQAADSGNTRLALGSRVGTDLRDAAKVVILKPMIGETVSSDAGEWYVIPAGTIMAKINQEHAVESDGLLWTFEIEGHPVTADEIASGGRLAADGFAVGDVLVLGD